MTSSFESGSQSDDDRHKQSFSSSYCSSEEETPAPVKRNETLPVKKRILDQMYDKPGQILHPRKKADSAGSQSEDDWRKQSFSSYASSEDDTLPAKKRKIAGIQQQAYVRQQQQLQQQKQQRQPKIVSGQNAAETLSDSEEEEDDERPVMGNQMMGGGGLLGMGGGIMAGLGMGGPSIMTDGQDVPENNTLTPESFLVTPGQKGGSYSTFAGKMMAKMGYEEGKGLGKHGQGRVGIVEASTHRGRRGLGQVITGFEPTDTEWDFEKEEASAEETIEWLPQCTQPVPQLDDMLPAWVMEGQKKDIIDDETEFCSEKTLADVLQCKTVFDNLEDEEMRRARTKSNPYETIRGVFFQNRAAMKMANMDAVLDFMFTDPRDKHGRSVVPPNELLYFADVCAGPGGFSEYILWRKKYDAKGFGFTLKGPCDFKLEEFLAASSEMFEPHYGVNGLEGDGNIYSPANLNEFQSFVLKSTDGKGVHFVMADGGFSVDGQENLQEVMSKRLYLCQSLCALMILRPGGHFVCKLFDIFTPFSVGVIYLMYRAFERVSVFKPVTSRPANSERYIVCQGMRPDSTSVRDYMFELNQWFEQHSSILDKEDLREIVPLDKIKADQEFYQYIVKSNEMLGRKQANSLTKIRLFAQNQNLHEPRQSQIREECLKLWKIPDEVRTAPSRIEASALFQSLAKGDAADYFQAPENLDPDSLQKLSSIYNYRCVVAGSEKRYLLISRGKSYVFKMDNKNKWTKVDDIKVSLPQNTIVEVEFVQELRGEGKGQRRVMAIHILDAMFLCGVDIRDFHFNDRLDRIRKFVKAITRPTLAALAPVRVKDVYRLEEIGKVFDRLDMKVTKGSGGNRKLCYCCVVKEDEPPRFYLPTGIYFIKTVKEPWTMQFSKKSQKKYFFSTKTGESVFEMRPEAIASYRCCQKSKAFWAWENGVKVHDNQMNVDISKISKHVILDYVVSKR